MLYQSSYTVIRPLQHAQHGKSKHNRQKRRSNRNKMRSAANKTLTYAVYMLHPCTLNTLLNNEKDNIYPLLGNVSYRRIWTRLRNQYHSDYYYIRNKPRIGYCRRRLLGSQPFYIMGCPTRHTKLVLCGLLRFHTLENIKGLQLLQAFDITITWFKAIKLLAVVTLNNRCQIKIVIRCLSFQ